MNEFGLDFPFSDPSPYPLVSINEKNPTFARYILDNVGGRNSEITTVALYRFNIHKLRSEANLSPIFHHISVVEMHHLDIFSELAMALGETPLFWSNSGHKRIWWSPTYTDYPGNLPDILDLSTKHELEAIEKYKRQIELIDDLYIQAVLKRIIKDEELHVKIFTSLYDRLC